MKGDRNEGRPSPLAVFQILMVCVTGRPTDGQRTQPLTNMRGRTQKDGHRER